MWWGNYKPLHLALGESWSTCLGITVALSGHMREMRMAVGAIRESLLREIGRGYFQRNDGVGIRSLPKEVEEPVLVELEEAPAVDFLLEQVDSGPIAPLDVAE